MMRCGGTIARGSKRKPRFDPKIFLAKADGGKTIANHHKKQVVFSQGDPADALFYIQQGKVKLTAVSNQGKEAVLALLGVGDFFGEGCLAGQQARNIRIEEDLVDQLFNSSEKRPARVLLLLANFGKEGKPEPVIPQISQETLAEIIGTRRSRVSFFMNSFRKLGFIDYAGDCVDCRFTAR
jgi:CRP/FNR family transcriptional regulator, cyclic AMP receptor protein